MRHLIALLLIWLSNEVCQAQNQDWTFRQSLDSLLQTYSLGNKAPGFAVCIVSNGAIVYEYQTGMANLEQNIPITAQTIFNIGSVSKQFTAACIQILQEQGKLSLDDPIHQYIPELPNFGAVITLHHLISHTSGLHGHIEVQNLALKYKTAYYNKKIRIRKKGHLLVLKPVFFMRYPLEPITPEVYKIRKDGIVIRFTDTGFTLGDDWVRNLKFSRL